MRAPCELAEDRSTTGSEVTVMARQLVIEEESGTCSRGTHVHNGYFAWTLQAGFSTISWPMLGPEIEEVATRAPVSPVSALDSPADSPVTG